MMLQKQQFDKIINYCKSKLKDIILDIDTLPEYKLAPYRASYATYLYTIKYCKSLDTSKKRIYQNEFVSHFKSKKGDERYCYDSIYRIINFVGAL